MLGLATSLSSSLATWWLGSEAILPLGFFFSFVTMVRHRGVFPFPVPRVDNITEEALELSRSSRRRLESRSHEDVWVRDIVTSLNEMFCGSEEMGNFEGDGRPTLSQTICLETFKQVVRDAGKPPADVTGREALAELQTRPGYAGDPAHLAPMNLDLLSLPSPGSRGATMTEIFEDVAESFVQRLMTKVSADAVSRQRIGESGLRAPYVDPMIRESPRLYASFCRKLEASGLLEYRQSCREQVGVFTVWKKSGKQRLVIDARLANMHFETPEKVRLATGTTFAAMEVDSGPPVEVGGVDIADAFYHIELVEPLREFFALPKVKAGDAGCGFASGSKVAAGSWVYPCLKVVPMGWTHALWVCQVAHQFVVDRNPSLDPMLRCVDREPVPDFNDYVHTQYVDNFVAFSQRPGRARELAEKIGVALNQHGLPTHEVEAQAGMETLGWAFCAEHPTVTLTSKRLWRLRLATKELLKVGVADGKLVEKLLGHYTFAGLLHRGFLSIFQACYVFVRKHYRQRVPLWPEVARELRWASSLVCLIRRDMGAKWSTKVHATDASMWGRGVVSCERSLASVRTLGKRNDRWRFNETEEHKVVRVESLFAADGIDEEKLQTKEELQLGEVGKGDTIEVPLGFIGEDWSKVDGAAWDRTEPIPILEGRAVVWLAQHLARSQKNLGKKHLVLSDSMSVTLALTKGRSSASSMNRICRQMAALELCTGMHFHLRWIPSELNPADLASRAGDVRDFNLQQGLQHLQENHAAQKSRRSASGWRSAAVKFHSGSEETKEAELREGEGTRHPSTRDGSGSEGGEDFGSQEPEGRSASEASWNLSRSPRQGGEDIPGEEVGDHSKGEELPEGLERADCLGQGTQAPPGLGGRRRPRGDQQDEPDVLRWARPCRLGDLSGSREVLPGGHSQSFRFDQVQRGSSRFQETGSTPRQSSSTISNVVCHMSGAVAIPKTGGDMAAPDMGNVCTTGGDLKAQEEGLSSPNQDVQALGGHSQLRRPGKGGEVPLRECHGDAGAQAENDVQGRRERRGSHPRPGVHAGLGLLHPTECQESKSRCQDLRRGSHKGNNLLQRGSGETRLQEPRDQLCVPSAPRKCQHRRAHRSQEPDRGAEEGKVGNCKKCPPLLQRRQTLSGLRQSDRGAERRGHCRREVDHRDFRLVRASHQEVEAIGLEVFAGSGHFSRAVRRKLKKVCCVEVDICHGPQFDLLKQRCQQELLALVKSGKVVYVWLGTPCNSWSRARRWDGRGPGPLRDDHQFLLGYPDLSPKDQLKVENGNSLMRFSAKLFRLCLHLGIPVALENPHTSRLWLAPPIKHLLHHRDTQWDYTDFCMDGKPFRKRTRLLWANVDLRYAVRQCHGKRGICACSGLRHQQLQGSQGGQFLTLLAQPYPHRLCQRLSTAFQHAYLHRAAEGLWDLIGS